MTGIYLNDFNCGLKAYKYDVVKNIEVYGEMHRYIPAIANGAGFTKIRGRRHSIKSEPMFGLERFINGFWDLLSISWQICKNPCTFWICLEH